MNPNIIIIVALHEVTLWVRQCDSAFLAEIITYLTRALRIARREMQGRESKAVDTLFEILEHECVARMRTEVDDEPQYAETAFDTDLNEPTAQQELTQQHILRDQDEHFLEGDEFGDTAHPVERL